MKLIGALGTFAFIMVFAVIAAFAIGWLMSLGGSLLTSLRALFPLVTGDPVIMDVAGFQHSHDRSQALLSQSDCATGGGSDGDCSCGE